MKTILAGALTALVLVVGAFGYLRMGWDRMEYACSTGNYGVDYSFTADGFTCTYGNGNTRSSWWF